MLGKLFPIFEGLTQLCVSSFGECTPDKRIRSVHLNVGITLDDKQKAYNTHLCFLNRNQSECFGNLLVMMQCTINQEQNIGLSVHFKIAVRMKRPLLEEWIPKIAVNDGNHIRVHFID